MAIKRVSRWGREFSAVHCLQKNRHSSAVAVFHSLVELQAAIDHYLTKQNRSPEPFIWTAGPDRIIAAASPG